MQGAFARHDWRVSSGRAVDSVQDAFASASESATVVVKAQVRSGRGKAAASSWAWNDAELRRARRQPILGMTQGTSSHGLDRSPSEHASEYYASVLLDRSAKTRSDDSRPRARRHLRGRRAQHPKSVHPGPASTRWRGSLASKALFRSPATAALTRLVEGSPTLSWPCTMWGVAEDAPLAEITADLTRGARGPGARLEGVARWHALSLHPDNQGLGLQNKTPRSPREGFMALQSSARRRQSHPATAPALIRRST